ncbi:MAG: hypothetical protein ACRDJ2_09855 [Actinomycetota bacterium]
MAAGAPLAPARALAIGAVCLLAPALVLGWPQFVAPALVACAAEYAFFLFGRDGIDPAAPLMAAGLVVAAELAYLSISVGDLSFERALLFRGVGRTLVLGAFAGLAGALMLGLSGFRLGAGLAVDLLGAAAAVTTLVIVAALARRSDAGR